MGKNTPMKNVGMGQWLLLCGALLCLLYFAGLWIYLGAIYMFQWFWAALGAMLLIIRWALPRRDRFPRWLRIAWKTAVILGLTLFLAVEGLMVSAMADQPEPGAAYLIVLGAKVNGTTPSLSLRYRIEAAYEYLEENPETKVIASGGQGANEGISEAAAIKNTLTAMGTDPERVILEDKSTSTNENLTFSKALIESMGGDPEGERTVVVSSDFHIFRAKAIARKSGFARVEGKGARSVALLQPNYCVREFFAILNDGIRGNLR